MPKNYLDQAYDARTSDETQALYDKWSSSYDDELLGNGYVTPIRAAKAFESLLTDKKSPVLDFGCGTGLFGQALTELGFETIDGVDLSLQMLDKARDKNIYRDLWQIEAGASLRSNPGDYEAIAAIGVLGVGAAPVETLDIMFDALAPHGLMGFSLNDHALAEPAFKDKVDGFLSDNKVVRRFHDYGDHLPEINLRSAVYIFEKK